MGGCGWWWYILIPRCFLCRFNGWVWIGFIMKYVRLSRDECDVLHCALGEVLG